MRKKTSSMLVWRSAHCKMPAASGRPASQGIHRAAVSGGRPAAAGIRDVEPRVSPTVHGREQLRELHAPLLHLYGELGLALARQDDALLRPFGLEQLLHEFGCGLAEALSHDQIDLVPRAEFGLEVERGADAAQRAVCNVREQKPETIRAACSEHAASHSP